VDIDSNQSSVGINDAPTIDEIDVANTPSLVGYWKFTDTDGTTVVDHSMYEHDLTISCAADIAGSSLGNCREDDAKGSYVRDTMLSRFPGYVSFGYGVGALRNITGEVLASTDKIVLTGAEFAVDTDPSSTFNGNPNSAVDFDIGTYWAGDDGSTLYNSSFSPATGFNLMALGVSSSASQSAFRVSDATDTYFRGMTGNLAGASGFTIDGIYDPLFPLLDARVSVDGIPEGIGTSGTVVPTTAPPQQLNGKPYFGVRAQNSFAPNWGIRNLYVWMLDSSRADRKILLNFMQSNPGKIPPWLIGK